MKHPYRFNSFCFMLFLASALIVACLPLETQAVSLYNPLSSLGGMNTPKEEVIVNFVASVIRAASAVVIGLALIFIIIGGILYMLSAGNEERMGVARRMIVYAVMGIAIVIGAAVFLKEIAAALGGGSGGFLANFSGASQFTQGTPSMAQVLERAISLVLTSLGMLGIIGIIIGGLWYLNSGGDQQRMEIGKKTLLYSILGLVIAIGSLIIVKQIAALF